MKFASIVTILVVFAAGSAMADPAVYHLGSASQRTNITFASDTDFESILGSTQEIGGRVVADLKKGTGSVEIAIPVASLRTGIEMRDEHLRSPMWLDAPNHPNIEFKSTSARRLDGDKWLVKGTFTFHGVSRELELEANVRPIPEAAAKAAGLEAGDWIRVTAPFTVRLSDYGVKVPEMAAAKVNDEWKIRLVAFATTVK
ncbi:MAG: YceI family protein [Thermoanaerobaculia bacterium]